MAIYHATTKPIARSAGRSSVAAAAYRAACELVDERTGLIHDYTKKGGVVSTELITPDNLGVDRNTLWNAAETAEKRKDGRTAREWIVALPSELNQDQRQELAHSFGVKLSERFEVAVDIAIHQPDKEGDNRNHHAHILTTTRKVGRDENGGLILTEKATIELSDKARRAKGLGSAADEITAIRQLWEQTANQALEKAGHEERIDSRTLEAQGIDREATTHLGAVATDMERRGITSNRGDDNRQVEANNQERVRLSAEIINLKAIREAKEEKQKQTANITDAELPREWEINRNYRAAKIRDKAGDLKERIKKQLGAVQKKMHINVTREPKRGLFGVFKPLAFEKAHENWAKITKQLLNRQTNLSARLERIEKYLSKNYIAGGFLPDKAEKKADFVMRRANPELAKRLDSILLAQEKKRLADQELYLAKCREKIELKKSQKSVKRR